MRTKRLTRRRLLLNPLDGPSDGNYADVAAEFVSVQRMLDVAERLIRIADALLDHANTIVVAAERRTYEASIRVPDRGSVKSN